jgi:sporulation protein YlmC with PRC-barrel domain
MTTDNIRLRSEFLNTQIITRNTGKRLGVVKEILVDIDRREVVSLGLRDNLLSVSGIPKYMYLNSISQTGDVVLVEDEDVIEDVDVEAYNKLVSCEVITETGQLLGKVRDFQFNPEDGRVISIIIASIGLPQIPEQLISTYEIAIDEVVSSGPNRLIVFEGAEQRIVQVSVGLLERLGIGRAPWEREEEEIYSPPVAKPENQLPSGVPIRPPVITPVKAKATIVEEDNWDEDEWQAAPSEPPLRRKAETVRYEEYEEDDVEETNWSAEIERPQAKYEAPTYKSKPSEPEYDYDDEAQDMWDDDSDPEPEAYNAPPLNISEKKKEKAPEYEEEMS